MNLTILSAYRENTRGVCLDHWRKGRVEMVEDGCQSKGRFEELKGVLTLQRPDPRGVLARKPSEWDGDIGVRGDEPSVEVCETQERLDVLASSWCRPVADYLDLRGVHSPRKSVVSTGCFARRHRKTSRT